MMQDYDPKCLSRVVLDYFAEIRDIAKVLALCLEQIDDDPPDLIPRLHWLIESLQSATENIGDDGFHSAIRLKAYFDELEPAGDDQSDDPGGDEE